MIQKKEVIAPDTAAKECGNCIYFTWLGLSKKCTLPEGEGTEEECKTEGSKHKIQDKHVHIGDIS